MTADLSSIERPERVTARRERLLMLITRNQRRGAELFAATMADQLGRRGLDVRLRSLAPSVGVPALRVESLGTYPLGLGTLRNLRREIETSDVVVACGSKTLPASVLASTGLSRPIIYQNIGDPLYWADTHLRRARVRALLRRTSAVAALTDQSAAALESTFRVPTSRIKVIRNARSSTTFQPANAAEKARARRRIGLRHDELVVAMVGALSPEKRVDVAISAIGRIVGPVRLVVAGEGPLRAELGAQAASTAPGRVSFLGRCTDVSAIFNAADAVVLTSVSEGLPGVLIEAGLSGLPVVATDVGYVRDIVVDGQTGYLIPSGDAAAAASSLERALQCGPELGTNARRHCVERFDLVRAIDEWVALIRQVTNGAEGGVNVEIPG